MFNRRSSPAFLAGFIALGLSQGIAAEAEPATPATIAANARFAQSLDLAETQGFEDARRGLIARPSGTIKSADGSVLVDLEAYAFVKGPAPATVNPSLWRQATLNAESGLFKVTEGVHQLRGFDIGNMTLIEGRTGWIVVDPLTARESAAAAIAFARQHLGDKPVSAIIFTHSHLDHYGGVLGVTSAADVAARGIPIVAPEGFMEEATSENVLVGPAMVRRSSYQFGKDLDRSAIGNVDTGLGKGVVYGTFGILPPTTLITQATEERVLDGVRFVFHNVPSAEAPSELTFEIPALKAYCGSEILTHTMHNLLPVRGAKVRDSKLWSRYLDQALEHVQGAEVFFASHHWPVWGQARIVEFISKQRDVYQYMHDQTVRLINAGYTANEIADQIRLPKSLASFLPTRGYYGDLRHNVKAVYQHYIGFYDGNPANLDPLPPEDRARRYLDLIGGADAATATARKAFDRGEYRWVAELLNHVMFVQPEHAEARALLIRSYEQLGYVAEAATWRNSYLTAAAELRRGVAPNKPNQGSVLEQMRLTPFEQILGAMAASLDGPAADGVDLRINLTLTDTQKTYRLWIENAVLHYREAVPFKDAHVSLTLSKTFFLKLMTGAATLKDAQPADGLRVEGNTADLGRFFGLLRKPDGAFAIVTR